LNTARHQKIGIKQLIRLEWMDTALDMLLAGMPADSIRAELKAYLADKKPDGGIGPRGANAYIMTVSILMQIWIEPENILVAMRDSALQHVRSLSPHKRLPYHWAMMSAAYPFWFHVAMHTGRLLNLQDQATQKQIFTRLKEQYGDRQTVSRYGQFVIRSFIVWGILRDTEIPGCYVKVNPIKLSDKYLASLLLESALHAIPEGKSTLNTLLTMPAMFPFELPIVTGEQISYLNHRLEISHTAGFNDYTLKLPARPELHGIFSTAVPISDSCPRADIYSIP